MLKTETIMLDERQLLRTWSDKNMLIRNIDTGDLYCEAVDPKEISRVYEETDIPCDDDEIEDSEAIKIITGKTIY